MALSRRSRITRNILLCVGLYLLAAAIIIARGDAADRATSSNIPLHVAEPRICAAATVYMLAEDDDWSQRAAIAQAALNRFDVLGHVPNCSSLLTAAVESGLDTYQWQAALDAVDAIQSGSYALPLACARADTVIPLTGGTGSPLFRPHAARAQCVIGDLAFVEAR